MALVARWCKGDCGFTITKRHPEPDIDERLEYKDGYCEECYKKKKDEEKQKGLYKS